MLKNTMYVPTQEIPYGYCHCGCGQLAPIAKQNHKKSGHIKGQPVKFLKWHNIRQTIPLEKRFWEKIINNGPDKCWDWIGSLNSNGYGQISVNKRAMAIHRVSWMLHFGPTPEGVEICHKCDNPRCANPNHLFLGTHTDNVRDMHTKGRGFKPQGEKSPNSKMTDIKVREMRQRHANGESAKELAKYYGIGESNARNIIGRRAWKHVE